MSRSTHVRDLCYGGIRRQWVASKTSRRHGARGRNPARLDRGMQIDVETGCASPVMIRCSGFYGPRATAQNLARRLGAVQRAQGPALHFQPSSVRTKSQRFSSTIRSQAEVCCAQPKVQAGCCADSTVEGNGFETSVPRHERNETPSGTGTVTEEANGRADPEDVTIRTRLSAGGEMDSNLYGAFPVK